MSPPAAQEEQGCLETAGGCLMILVVLIVLFMLVRIAWQIAVAVVG